MAFIEARQIAAGATLDADVCIAGAGPAGLAVAMELVGAGRRVLVLESGGMSIEAEVATLDEIESTGAPLRATGPLRDRRFGGTAWYGRCVALDAIDFEPRSWVPSSGWPISQRDVEAYYPRAARFLGLAHPEALASDFWKDQPAYHVLTGGGLAARVHLFTDVRDVGLSHRRLVASSSQLTVVLHATVVGIAADDASRSVTHLRIMGPDGREFSSRAKRYVLACGGLENARLLLMLSRDYPGALGVSCNVLGRGYMNHPRCEGVARLRLDPGHRDYLSVFRRLAEGRCGRNRIRMQLAAGIDADTQRREGLVNASAFFYVSSLPRLADLAVHANRLRQAMSARRFRRTDVAAALRLARKWPVLAGAGLSRLRRRPYLVDSLVMVEQIEQVAERESYVALGDGRDRFGRPTLTVHWHIDAATLRTQRRFHGLLAERFRQLRIGTFESALLANPDLEPEYGDAAHPMGSTRMSKDPSQGVVDRHGRVHALENLYVAGSSVFPTGGHANPTLTLVALAIRLGESLRQT